MSDRRRLILNNMRREMKTRTLNYLLARSGFSSSTPFEYAQGRDYRAEYGHPKEAVSFREYLDLYRRGDIARRVIDFLPDESWSVYPDVYEKESTKEKTGFEADIRALIVTKQLWHYVHRADKRSRIGNYGTILIGINDGKKLSEPAAGIDPRTGEMVMEDRPQDVEVTFFQVYDQGSCYVSRLEEDERSPRFCMPVEYTLKAAASRPPVAGEELHEPRYQDTKVHWTRIQHIADNVGASDVYGDPAMEVVLDRTLDVRKVAGASGEMFYRGGLPGWAIQALPEWLEDGEDENPDELKEEFDAWSSGMQRFIRLVGFDMKSLAPQVADPTAHIEMQIRLICIALGVPRKVFEGSERSESAADQDTRNWNRRLGQRQQTYLEPRVVRPLIDRLIMLGAVRAPARDESTGIWEYVISWADLNALSDLQKADRALKRTQAISQYVTSKAYKFFPPREYFSLILGMTDRETEQVIKAAGGDEGLKKMITEMEDKELNNQLEIAKAKAAVRPQGGARSGNKPPRQSPGSPGTISK